MKTHSQTRGKKPFDWNAALAKDCKKMTEAEASTMYGNASTWVTCACGNQCAIIPRDSYGQPLDGSLRDLGMLFTDYVSDMFRNYQYDEKTANASRKNAIKTLHKIERISQRLINVEVREAMNVLKTAGRLPK
jgi:hypothetical protein